MGFFLSISTLWRHFIFVQCEEHDRAFMSGHDHNTCMRKRFIKKGTHFEQLEYSWSAAGKQLK